MQPDNTAFGSSIIEELLFQPSEGRELIPLAELVGSTPHETFNLWSTKILLWHVLDDDRAVFVLSSQLPSDKNGISGQRRLQQNLLAYQVPADRIIVLTPAILVRHAMKAVEEPDVVEPKDQMALRAAISTGDLEDVPRLLLYRIVLRAALEQFPADELVVSDIG